MIELRGATAANAQKTSCPKGHLYADENLQITSEGFRRCATCRREQRAAQNAARRAKRGLNPPQPRSRPSSLLRALERHTDTSDPSACWVWGGHIDRSGYGRTYWQGRYGRSAHRAVYEHLRGEIPPGLHLDHLCRNRACVNPEHLEPVTARENNARSIPFRSSKTHCPYGHPYDPANTYVYRDARRCRSCLREKARRYADRKRKTSTDTRQDLGGAPGATGGDYGRVLMQHTTWEVQGEA